MYDEYGAARLQQHCQTSKQESKFVFHLFFADLCKLIHFKIKAMKEQS